MVGFSAICTLTGYFSFSSEFSGEFYEKKQFYIFLSIAFITCISHVCLFSACSTIDRTLENIRAIYGGYILPAYLSITAATASGCNKGSARQCGVKTPSNHD